MRRPSSVYIEPKTPRLQIEPTSGIQERKLGLLIHILAERRKGQTTGHGHCPLCSGRIHWRLIRPLPVENLWGDCNLCDWMFMI